MSKTADLRKLIVAQLRTLTAPKGVYYRQAAPNAVYPYLTFSLDRVDESDLARDDVDLCVDVWDHAPDPGTIEGIADAVEALFNNSNLPQQGILPTFFRDTRYPVTEDDKTIQHIQLHFVVQNYENE